MVFSSPLGQSIRESIALQIAERLPSASPLEGLNAPGSPNPSLGESLKIMTFIPTNEGEQAETLKDLLEDQEYWHHQIYAGETTTGYARSIAEADDPGAPHDVLEFGTSELPDRLQNGFDWLDENVAADAQADIISVPSHFVTAIWVHGDGLDHTLVVSQANSLNFPTDRLIGSREFVKELQAAPPIDGLGPLPEQEA